MLVFIDEAGDTNFSASGSRFFIITAVIAPNNTAVSPLQELRHALASEGYSLPVGFHAKQDPRPRRQRVFNTLAAMDIRAVSVALDKRKALPRIARNPAYCYRLAFYFLFRWFSAQRASATPSLLIADQPQIIVSAFGAGELQRETTAGLESVVKQHSVPPFAPQLLVWENSSHVGLQAADYVCWAIQRHLERNDADAEAAMAVVRPKLIRLMEPFAESTTTYY